MLGLALYSLEVSWFLTSEKIPLPVLTRLLIALLVSIAGILPGIPPPDMRACCSCMIVGRLWRLKIIWPMRFMAKRATPPATTPLMTWAREFWVFWSLALD